MQQHTPPGKDLLDGHLLLHAGRAVDDEVGFPGSDGGRVFQVDGIVTGDGLDDPYILECVAQGEIVREQLESVAGVAVLPGHHQGVIDGPERCAHGARDAVQALFDAGQDDIQPVDALPYPSGRHGEAQLAFGDGRQTGDVVLAKQVGSVRLVVHGQQGAQILGTPGKLSCLHVVDAEFPAHDGVGALDGVDRRDPDRRLFQNVHWAP